MSELEEVIARLRLQVSHQNLHGSRYVQYEPADLTRLLDAADAAQKARDAALEEAAKECEALGRSMPAMPLYDLATQHAANRIRALRGAA